MAVLYTQPKGKVGEEEYNIAKERYFKAMTQEGRNYPIDTAQRRADHILLQKHMKDYEPGKRWTTLPLKDAAYQVGNTLRSWINQLAGTHYKEGGKIRKK